MIGKLCKITKEVLINKDHFSLVFQYVFLGVYNMQ